MGEFADLLSQTSMEAGLVLDERQLRTMERYSEILHEWNQKLNLTSITDPLGVAVKHFVDSLATLKGVAIPIGARAYDVGSGCGFPGLVLKLARPDLDMCLIEATRKKAEFLRAAAADLEVDVEVVNGRVEDVARDPRYRGMGDLAVARAVARLNVLCEYCIPLLTVHGSFVALKGPEAADEVLEARTAMERLNSRVGFIYRYDLPRGMGARTLVVVEKIGDTPAEYPRRAGLPSKKPL